MNRYPEVEAAWEPLVQVLAAMIVLSSEFVVLQVYTPDRGDCGPYVQTLQEDEGALTLEAASNEFLNPQIGPDATNTLAELGWSSPDPEDGLPNFTMLVEAEDVDPGRVATFLVKTLRDAYLVSPKDKFQFAPGKLFQEIMRGEFGSSPDLRMLPLDLDGWKSEIKRQTGPDR